MRTLALLASLTLSLAATLAGCEEGGARIGVDEVPSHLRCEEDEGIGYDPRDPGPRTLKCVPYEVWEAQ